MIFGKKSAAAYGRVANAEADPIRQLVMLYDGAIKFLRLSAGDIESGDLRAKAEHTGRALDIIAYLQSILDYERGGEVAPALDALYCDVTAMTLRASAALNAHQMRIAADLLVPVREAWAANAHAAGGAGTAASDAPSVGDGARPSLAVGV